MPAKRLYIWLVSRAEDDSVGWDEYDSFVVIAATENEARHTHPRNGRLLSADWKENLYGSWPVQLPGLNVTKLGRADEGQGAGIVIASFNAG